MSHACSVVLRDARLCVMSSCFVMKVRDGAQVCFVSAADAFMEMSRSEALRVFQRRSVEQKCVGRTVRECINCCRDVKMC